MLSQREWGAIAWFSTGLRVLRPAEARFLRTHSVSVVALENPGVRTFMTYLWGTLLGPPSSFTEPEAVRGAHPFRDSDITPITGRKS